MDDPGGGGRPPDPSQNFMVTQAYLNAMGIVGEGEYLYELSPNQMNTTANHQQSAIKRPLIDSSQDILNQFPKKLNTTTLDNNNILQTNPLNSEEQVLTTTTDFIDVNQIPGTSSTNVNNNNNIKMIENSSNKNENISQYDLNKSNRYNGRDKGPFFILIESKDKNIGKLHKVSIGKLIFNNFITERNDIEDVNILGRNKIKVVTKTFETANKILEAENFQQKNRIQAYIPQTVLFRKGVIKNVDPDLTDDEIRSVINSSVKVVNVRRITRKNLNPDISTPYVNTLSIILTFRGQSLPDFVSIYGARCAVSPFIYRVTQCLNCLRYGHLSKQCRSAKRCSKCGENHEESICNTNSPKCTSCNGTHPATDPTCPERKNQTEIKKYMAFNNVGYKEAKSRFKSYSEIAATPASQVPNFLDYNRFQPLQNYQEFTPEKNMMDINTSTYQRPVRRPTRSQIPNRPPHSGSTSTYITSHATFQDEASSSSENNSFSSYKGITNPYTPQYHLKNSSVSNQNHNVQNSSEFKTKLFTVLFNILAQIANNDIPNPADIISAINNSYNSEHSQIQSI